MAFDSMILVFVLLISVSSTALAASAQNNAQTVNESQINISELDPDLPAVGNLTTTSASTVKSTFLFINETRITVNESDQSYPAIYGDRIVWTDERNGNSDIFMCTVSEAIGQESSTETEPATDTQDSEHDSAVSGSEEEQKPETGKITSIPGFEAIYVVASFLTLFPHKRK